MPFNNLLAKLPVRYHRRLRQAETRHKEPQDSWHPAGTFPFLQLPAELRMQIYEYLLTPEANREHVMIVGRRWDGSQDHCCGMTDYKGQGRPITPCLPAKFYPQILRTNKQIHNEAVPVLYNNVEFRIEVHYDGTTSFDQLPQTYLPEIRNILVAFSSAYGPEWESSLAGLASLWPVLRASCPSLQHLKLHLDLRKLRAIETFNVTAFHGVETLPWSLKEVEVSVHGRSVFCHDFCMPMSEFFGLKDLWRTMEKVLVDEMKEYLEEQLVGVQREDVAVSMAEAGKGCLDGCKSVRVGLVDQLGGRAPRELDRGF